MKQLVRLSMSIGILARSLTYPLGILSVFWVPCVLCLQLMTRVCTIELHFEWLSVLLEQLKNSSEYSRTAPKSLLSGRRRRVTTRSMSRFSIVTVLLNGCTVAWIKDRSVLFGLVRGIFCFIVSELTLKRCSFIWTAFGVEFKYYNVFSSIFNS